ncbi:hypothetical protein P2318_12610 [Myxococcaceae bacterium GXIMD 01537]
MRRIAFTVTLGLAAVGCVRTLPFTQRVQVEQGKCDLVRTLMREPVPSRLVSEFHGDTERGEPAPVMVYLRRPQESALERFFDGSPDCADTAFRVVQEATLDAVVVYLEAVSDGYSYDARRSNPEELTMAGVPQGTVRRDGMSWVSVAN